MFRHLLSLIFLSVFCYSAQPVYGDVIVSMEVQQGTMPADIDTVYIHLFDRVAPLTVANFLKYANGSTTNGGSYNNSFVHRSVPNFVIQGGGFSYDPANGGFVNNPAVNNFPEGLKNIAEDPQVDNEFNLSNLRGAISMAQAPGNPNSATNQWFINLVDNSSSLDREVGKDDGFVVFGSVIGNGMTVVDEMAARSIFPLTGIHGAFGQLPLVDYVSGSVSQDNLVRVNNVTELINISADSGFTNVFIGSSKRVDITVENKGGDDIEIGSVADTDTLVSPFVIVDDDCSNKIIAASVSCVITVEFTPLIEGAYTDSFNIEFTNLSLSFVYDIKGVGAVGPKIVTSVLSLDFGDVKLPDPDDDSIQFDIGVINTGVANLDFVAIQLTGPDTGDYSIMDNCVRPLSPIDICTINLFFKPLSLGEKKVVLEIETNDLDDTVLEIPVVGVGALDEDNVTAAIESASPNNGDGNYDGIQDSVQNHVVSVDHNGNGYITFLALEEYRFRKFNSLDKTQIAPAPSGIELTGAFELELLDISTITDPLIAEVGLIFPQGVVLNSFYLYGPTPDNTNPHWYEFLFDGLTGAQIFGDVEVTTLSGETIKQNVVKLFFVDSLRGDNDLEVNRKITIQASYVLADNNTSGSSGTINFYFMSLLIIILYFRILAVFHNKNFTLFKK